MARIRTIKPGFRNAESMGRVSREARLLFILLWTEVDDEGRAYADLSELVRFYPSDRDAAALLPGWLAELEREGCIERYAVNAVDYLRVVHWHKHQKIDHPTPSKLPPSPSEPPPDSRIRESREEFRESDPNALRTRDSEGPDEIRENFEDSSIRENPDEPREVTEARVLRDIARILAKSEARGSYAPALRAAELMGRRIGLWSAAARKRAALDDEDGGPPPDVLLPAEDDAAQDAGQ